MTEEELTKLDEARAREAEAQYFEQIKLPNYAKKVRAGELEVNAMTAIAARLARTGWMPPVDPRLEAAREITARIDAVRGFSDTAAFWRDPAGDTPNDKAVITYIASCLPEGYSVADLPPVPEKDQ